MEVSTRRSPAGAFRSSQADRRNGREQSDLGRGTDRRRTLVKDRHSDLPAGTGFVTSIVGFESIKNALPVAASQCFCERLIASARRECWDFVIPLNESHIRMILKLWVAHFNRGRPHSSLGPGIPEPSFPKVPLLNKRHHSPDDHRVSAIPVLGGLHHQYKLEKIAA